MKPDGKHKRKIAFLIVFVLALLAILAVVLTRDDSILGRALPVASVQGWAIPTFLNGYPTPSTAESSKLDSIYFWLSENELLSFRRSADGLIPLRTKLKSTMTGEVSEAIPGVLLKGKLEIVSVSHDGNSLLWFEEAGNHNIIAHIASLNGKKPTQFPNEDWKRFAWSPSDDSLLYAQNTRTGSNLLIRNVTNGSVRIVRSEKTPSLINDYSELSLSTSDTARFKLYDQSEMSQLCVGEVSLSRPSLPIKKILIPVPQNESREISVLSPKGDKILVITSRSAFNFWEKAMAKIHSVFPSKTTIERREWYVYSLDGNRKRLVYSNYVYSSRARYRELPGTGIGGVQWTPDGKHLSFIYQGMLYLLQVKH